jgi:transcriptional regulator of arginine metabolism
MVMPTAKQRRSALRKLLSSGHRGTQEQLCADLAARGFATTQSTISRDLKLLGAQRIAAEDGTHVYGLRTSSPHGAFPADMVVGIEHNESMVVVRTRIGRAQAVGLDLDAMRHPGMLGTLAGDDTVLVIPKSITQTAELAQRLRELAGLGS